VSSLWRLTDARVCVFLAPGGGGACSQVLGNEALRELLMDPSMQQVLVKCGEPGRLRAFMADPVWGPKIRTLADHGLVQIQR